MSSLKNREKSHGVERREPQLLEGQHQQHTRNDSYKMKREIGVEKYFNIFLAENFLKTCFKYILADPKMS